MGGRETGGGMQQATPGGLCKMRFRNHSGGQQAPIERAVTIGSATRVFRIEAACAPATASDQDPSTLCSTSSPSTKKYDQNCSQVPHTPSYPQASASQGHATPPPPFSLRLRPALHHPSLCRCDHASQVYSRRIRPVFRDNLLAYIYGCVVGRRERKGVRDSARAEVRIATPFLVEDAHSFNACCDN